MADLESATKLSQKKTERCPFIHDDECNREEIDLPLCKSDYAHCITYQSLNKIGLTAGNI